MPKSRFNAVRERARATRHNPVGGRKTTAANGQASQEIALPAASTPTKEEDVLPILKSLPLDSSVKVSPSEVLWALTSVTGFLSEKISRTQVLAPQHKLISRVLLQLNNNNEYQIRDAASGCLRNMCIEAGGKTCKALEDQGCVEKCIEEIKTTAKKLALTESDEEEDAEEVKKAANKEEEAVQLQNKPKESLNRKERRQLAKIETAAAKKNGKKEPDVVMNEESGNESGEAASKPIDEDIEQLLLYYSHMNNLVAIVWCLVEISPKAVDVCNRSAHVLSRILVSTLDKTRKSLSDLCRTIHEVKGEEVIVDAKWRDVTLLDIAIIKLASNALNTMMTLTDSNVDFSAATVGISKEKLRQYQRKTKKAFIIDADTEGESEGDLQQDGILNVQAFVRSISTVQELYHVDERPRTNRVSSLQRQATSLALFSVATLRNIHSCLPDAIRNSLKIRDCEEDEDDLRSYFGIRDEREEDRYRTLGQIEMIHLLPETAHSLYIVSDEEVNEDTTVFLTLEYLNDEEHGDEKTETEVKADSQVSNLTLGLEVIAEMAADREGWYKQTGSQRGIKEDEITIDDEGNDEEMEMDEIGDDEEDDNQSEMSMESAEEGEIDLKDVQVSDFKSVRIAKIHDHCCYYLSGISKQTVDGFLLPKRKDGSEMKEYVAVALRLIAVRALSAFNNIYLGLASFAQLPPSQSQRNDSELKSFQAWLGGGHMNSCWNQVFEYASLVAALPCLSQEEDSSSLAQDARKVMELCLCILWSISRCFEGVDAKKSHKTMNITQDDFAREKYDEVTRAKNSLGVIPSLIAAYKTSKKISISTTIKEESNTANQLAPSPDGIRTHSLGVLSTLVRQSFVIMADKEKIINLLADVLEVLPTAAGLTSRLNSLEIRDSTSMDAMVVAVNGIIDTFANEESKWDHLYNQMKLQSRLKRASLNVKSAARTIDKRKQPALRAAADEAWSNLIAFLQYRDGLAK